MSSSSSRINLPTDATDWPPERVMAEVGAHALAQWGSIEMAAAVANHVVRCEDVYMITSDGRKLIDFNSQAVCTNLGYNCPEIADAVYDQMKNGCAMAESRWYVVTVRAKVIDFLRQRMPTMDRFYFSESGATAVEAAVRIARGFTGKQVILASARSYHGATAGAMTLTGGGDDRHFTADAGHMENVVHFIDHAPFYFKWGASASSQQKIGEPEAELGADNDEATDQFLAYLEEVIATNGGRNRVAAILLETMVGTQGAIRSPARYLLGVQALCRKYGCLLILDEVMGGFGRTGEWFAYQQHAGLEPDIVTMAKGLTNAYAPLGAVAVSKTVGDHFLKTPVPMGSTYNCHPTGLAAAWAALQLYEARGVMAHVKQVSGPHLSKGLQGLKAKHPAVVRAVRNHGCWGAMELVIPGPEGAEAEAHARVVKRVGGVLREKGLVTFCKYHRHMRCLYVMCNPPLVITPAQLDEAMAALDAACVAIAEETRVA